MRIAVCDDEPIFLEQVHHSILEYFDDNHLARPVIDMFDSGEKLLNNKKLYDIVFLDVEMPKVSGIKVGQALKQRNPNVIIFIVTAFNEYLDEAMQFRVFRYLTKPIDKQRLFRNLKQALEQYNTAIYKVAVETKENVYILYMSDIVYVETVGRKVNLYTKTRCFESTKNMQYWESKLTSGAFFKTHRSYIVNMKYVTKIDTTMVQLCQGQYSAYLTRRKYKEFKDAYLLYLESTR